MTPGDDLIFDVRQMFRPRVGGERFKVGEDVVDVDCGIGSGAASKSVVKRLQLGLCFQEHRVR